MQAERLLPTRVRRFYRGGALLGRFRGEQEEDAYLPEDWVGSTTLARNVEPAPESAPAPAEPAPPLSAGSVEPTPENEGAEGLSRLADGTLLRDAVAADPLAWLGEAHVARFGPATGLLVKLLDSAERLPVHAHPERAFAQAELGSAFGKTEAWIVLATRADEAEVWVGLREPVERVEYLEWIERQEVDRLLGSLNRLSVRAGDVVYVPGGVPHAIGAGVLLAELQEPTDLSLLCEWRGFPIRAEDSHLGLGWERAVRALDLRAHDPIRELPQEARTFFWADREPQAAGRFAILVVLGGAGAVDGEPARAGDAFALPASADRLDVAGDLELLRCLGPDPAR